MVISVTYTTQFLDEAPKEIADLVIHWRGLCGSRKYPSRIDIRPMELRPYLGSLCIIEIKGDPLDFVYRLFGSGLTEILQQDMTGRSVLDLPPAEFGQCSFEQLQEAKEIGGPAYFHTEVRYGQPPSTSGATQLVLPLSDDGEVVGGFLTYSQFDGGETDFWFRLLS